MATQAISIETILNSKKEQLQEALTQKNIVFSTTATVPQLQKLLIDTLPAVTLSAGELEHQRKLEYLKAEEDAASRKRIADAEADKAAIARRVAADTEADKAAIARRLAAERELEYDSIARKGAADKAMRDREIAAGTQIRDDELLAS